jgi:hypothetical protein
MTNCSQAVTDLELGAQLRGGLLAIGRSARVAGDDPREHEHEQDDPEEDGDAQEQPADDVADHPVGSSLTLRTLDHDAAEDAKGAAVGGAHRAT